MNKDLQMHAAEASSRGQLLLTWVVDTKPDLVTALRAGAFAVVSNEPLLVSSYVDEMCRRLK